jgi:hypothetical protein
LVDKKIITPTSSRWVQWAKKPKTT